jgi:flagellar assembly protein FliH
MTSSSPETAKATVLVGPAAHVAKPLAVSGRDLRTGSWTRLGGDAVLGDAVTEHALSGLVEHATAAARAQGYATGWAEGRRAAQEQARQLTMALTDEAREAESRREAEHRAALDGLRAAALGLETALGQLAGRLESHVTEVAVALTEALVGHELAVAESPGLDAVRRALALVPAEPVVRVRVAPEEAATAALAELAGPAVVVADPTLRRGDAVVETMDGVVDARVSGAVGRVREVLSL